MGADLRTQLETAAAAAAAYADGARTAVRPLVTQDDKLDREALDREQHLVHGLAWIATYAETLREVRDWARALEEAGKFGEIEQGLARLLVGEYSAQLAGGLPMTQVETIRPADFGLDAPAVGIFVTQADKSRLAALLREAQGQATFENTNLDHDLDLIRDQFRKFADDRIVPHAHGWHCRDELIPLDIVAEMGALGVFGLTIPEQYGGAGFGKTAMCVVSEELSRAWIGTGSLGTRSEIAKSPPS
jgi:(2S)-methylsuccinyl-CoA dehydrogenase